MSDLAQISRLGRRAALLLCGAGLLGACSHLPADQTPQAAIARTFSNPGGIDPKSPAAADVARISAEPTAFPRFSDIPAIASDVRKPAQWRASVMDLKAAGAQVAANSTPDTFTLTASDTFADSVKAQVNARVAKAPTAAEMAESAAFVKAARARATPPPRPH
jgi:hypothetical protein